MLQEEKLLTAGGDGMNIVKRISKFNHTKVSGKRNIKYIVIHYTGSLAGADNNAEYFCSADRGASAHYFVGHNGEIRQVVEDNNVAWHCGSKKGYKHPECRNNNSIGIEMCCKTTGDPQRPDNNWYFEDATVDSTIQLVSFLMALYEIPVENVIRHYDVTGKVCPAPYVYNNKNHTWDEFKKRLKPASTVEPEVKEVEFDKIIWDYFKKKGLNDYAVAGIMGNLQAESNFKPTNIQNSFEKKLGMDDITYTAAVDTNLYSKEAFSKDGAGYGLAQWTFFTRKAALYDFAKDRDASIGDIYMQLDFLWAEFTDRVKMLAEVSDAKSVKEASDIILHQFEKPKDQSSAVERKRAKLGQAIFDKFTKESSTMIEKKEKTEVVEKIETTEKPENVEERFETGEPIERFEDVVFVIFVSGEPIERFEDDVEPVFEPYKVKVEIPDLNIRKGPGTNFDKIGKFTGKGVFTIVEEKDGWGKLKSGLGWIKLSFTKRV